MDVIKRHRPYRTLIRICAVCIFVSSLLNSLFHCRWYPKYLEYFCGVSVHKSNLKVIYRYLRLGGPNTRSRCLSCMNYLSIMDGKKWRLRSASGTPSIGLGHTCFFFFFNLVVFFFRGKVSTCLHTVCFA